MKNLFIFLSLIMMFVLTACGGNKYDDAIDDVINQYKEYKGDDTRINVSRANSIVRVYDEGKYNQFAFYMPDDSSRELTTFKYYEKLGDEYKEMSDMPGNGENDRLGLSKKTPDYEEAKGKKTKLEE
ncbi:cystatin-like fold lipoprotein [Bacillus rugosus]|uniref:cystatin-like fold lipoprotein n=1 Tax=Bacillus rugosus TaxID=2715209 RepID=UPI002DB87925|nr:cystatin-like fold lipoprotein [Bacillus rugosus]MEC1549881.1 cystatin-like fold lipoprotein [Bacillus rugosus]